MRIGQTSFILLVFKILGSLIGFLAIIYFTRTLGEDIYGYYVLTLAIVSWAEIVRSIGLTSATIKRMSEGNEPYEYLFAGVLMKLALTTFAAFLVYVFRSPVNQYIGQTVHQFIILFLFANLLVGIVNTALKGTHRVHIYAPYSVSKRFFRYGLMIILVYLGFGLFGMLMGYVIGATIVGFIGLLVVRPGIKTPKLIHFKNLIDFAKYSWLGQTRSKSYRYTDVFVLGLFVPPGLVGIYGVALTIAGLFTMFSEAIDTTLFPELSKLSELNNDEKISNLVEKSLAYSPMFLIPGIVGAAGIGDLVLFIYGPNFDQGYEILVIIIAFSTVYALALQLLNTLNALDRPDLAFRTNAVFIVLNLILNIILVRYFGWMGAAVATLFSSIVCYALSHYYVRHLIEFQFPFQILAKQIVSAGIMGIVVIYSREIIEDIIISNEISVIVLSSIGGFVYISVLFLILPDFRNVISSNVKKLNY